ncbi:MAG: restriction endonuclease subunit S [Haemophilus parainfluenzae]|jgi:restriction modification system DNA specificity domain protein|nr:restriction endonuclease subunit S [Haemophilus parainfluenzae]MDU5637898.1 restriction endonuclease subunit S [Haemophilus parainfluenzae]
MKEDVLPEGWEIKRFEGVIDIQGGSQPPKSEFIYEEQENYIRLLQIRDFGEKPVPTFVPKNRVSKFCQETDILIARYGASLGRIVTGLSGAYNVALAKTIYDKSVLNDRFVFYLLQTPIFQKPLSMISRSAQNGFAKQDIADIKIPLPPLPEQQYLSQKLTALLDEVAQTKQRLEAIPAQLKQFRQSVLADAVSGRLMEIAPRMTKMSDIAKFQNGFAFNSEDFSKSGEWQVFRLGNIRDGFLFYENKPVFISEKLAKTQEKFIPKVGDSLISMTGTRFKQDYGFACIIEKDEKILVNQRVGRIIPIKDKIIPKFLNLSLRSEHFRQQFFKGETGGVNQGNVGSKHIMSISINLPTLEQQTQIVQKVETYFALADEIETQVNAALENVNLLTQSILSKAFSGELSAAWRTQQAVKN